MSIHQPAPPLTPSTRWILYIASALVFISGIQLFVLTEQTDQFFAWTINPPLTAAFLGAAYWASCAMEFTAARQPDWPRARIAIPAVFLFTTLTLIVTLLHIDRFHLARPEPLARSAAWAWLAVYAIVPIAMGIVFALQVRKKGAEPPRRFPLPIAIKGIIGVQGLILFLVGVMLLLTPELLIPHWPWKLTPLTGRAIGAWGAALGVALAHALWENDWQRIKVSTISYTIFGILELVALARYPGDIDWSKPQSTAYIVFMVSVIAAGLYSWLRSRQIESAPPVSATTHPSATGTSN
jgi:hypothetical protein